MQGDPTVRRLSSGDAAAFRQIRLEGLLQAPTAFGSSHEAESGRPEKEFAEMLERSYVAGAFLGEALAGVAGFFVLSGTKVSHRGNIWGVYVRPAARGQGLARAMMEHLVDHARGKVKQVHLSVVSDNARAAALYRHLGFVRYGVEPRALLIDGAYYDEDLMVLQFDI